MAVNVRNIGVIILLSLLTVDNKAKFDDYLPGNVGGEGFNL
ncbi:MAG: hypothetical protein ACJA13_003573 [Paraglaciecola sp.]|jgi:hypothetical protein